jgi:protein-tyrosine phosphatase
VRTVQDVFWINGKLPPPLAIVLRPRGGDWLEDELRRLKQQGIDRVVSMLETEEAAQLGLTEERATAEKVGLQFDSFPIPDRTTPANLAAFRDFVVGRASRLRAGERIGIHCRGSIGRATIAAACTLIQFGWSPQSALAAIESARGCPVPDTPEQQDWILRYEAGR